MEKENQQNVICFFGEKEKRTNPAIPEIAHRIATANEALFIAYVDQLEAYEQCQFVAFVLKVAQNLTHDGMFVDKAFMLLFLNHQDMSVDLIRELYRRFLTIKSETYKQLVEQKLLYLLDGE